LQHPTEGEVSTLSKSLTLPKPTGNVRREIASHFDAQAKGCSDINHQEGLIPKEFGQNAVEIPGARKLLASLEDVNAPWAVCTSGTRALLNGWLDVLKLAHPRTIVVAEDVEHGKPAPDCYLLGRKRLGLSDDSHMIVFEDAPSGVRAGKAAGFKVIGLTTTHTIGQVSEAGADWIVQDLSSVTLKSFQDGVIQIEISDALVAP
jgi:glycerol 3-phosphatase-1